MERVLEKSEQDVGEWKKAGEMAFSEGKVKPPPEIHYTLKKRAVAAMVGPSQKEFKIAKVVCRIARKLKLSYLVGGIHYPHFCTLVEADNPGARHDNEELRRRCYPLDPRLQAAYYIEPKVLFDDLVVMDNGNVALTVTNPEKWITDAQERISKELHECGFICTPRTLELSLLQIIPRPGQKGAQVRFIKEVKGIVRNCLGTNWAVVTFSWLFRGSMMSLQNARRWQRTL
jgi:hypothetical protein